MNTFEVYIEADQVSAFDWKRLVEGIGKYEKSFTLEVVFDVNKIKLYLYCKRDLGTLSERLEGFVFKKTTRDLEGLALNSIRKFMIYPTINLKDFLELKEAEKIKKDVLVSRITIKVKKIITKNTFLSKIYFKTAAGKNFHTILPSLTNPLNNFNLNFGHDSHIHKEVIPTYLKIDKTSRLFTDKADAGFLETDTFPYTSGSAFFPLASYDFDKHSLIVGQTGVGKSKLIELFVKNLQNQIPNDDYVVVVIDPHAKIFPHFTNLKKNTVNFDFTNKSCELFPAFSEPKIATELTILLFKTLLGGTFNAKMERVLKYTLYTLFVQNVMSLNNLKSFLTELEFRKQVLSSANSNFDFLSHFFDTEFTEMQTKFYEIAIMPILVLVDELSFIPAFTTTVVNHKLESALRENFLVSFSLNKIFLGEKATRLIAGLVIQQLFLIAQRGQLRKKIILIIDEVSLVENESLVNILSEARKFNLSLVLSQQYLTQITPELLKGILSNVYNYFVFKVSDEDAKILGNNLEIEIPEIILAREKKKGTNEDDVKRNLLVSLNPRECLVRVFSEGSFYPCFKAKTQDVN